MGDIKEHLERLGMPILWRLAATSLEKMLSRTPGLLGELLGELDRLDEKRRSRLGKVIARAVSRYKHVEKELVRLYLLGKAGDKILDLAGIRAPRLYKGRRTVERLQSIDAVLAEKIASLLADAYSTGQLEVAIAEADRVAALAENVFPEALPSTDEIRRSLEETLNRTREKARGSSGFDEIREALGEAAEHVKMLLFFDQTYHSIQTRLTALERRGPPINSLAGRLKKEAERTLTTLDLHRLVKIDELVRTLEESYTKLAKAGYSLEDLPPGIFESRPLEDSIGLLALVSGIAKAGSAVSISPSSIVEYIETLKAYPPQVRSLAISTLEAHAGDPDISRYIESGKPPYKIIAKSRNLGLPRLLRERLGPSLLGRWDVPGNITSIAWSPQGGHITVAYARHDGRRWASGIVVYSVDPWSELWHTTFQAPVWTLDWNDDNDLIAVGLDDGQILFLRGDDGTVSKTIKASGPVLSLKWVYGGHIIVATGWPSYALELYRLPQDLVWRKSYYGPITDVDWTPQAMIVASHKEGLLSFYTLDGRLTKTLNFPREVSGISVNPEKPLLAIVEEYILHVYELGEASELWSDKLHPKIGSAAWSPSGDILAVTSSMGHLVLYTSSGTRIWETSLSNAEPGPIAWSRAGGIVAVASTPGQLTLYTAGPVDMCRFSTYLMDGRLPPQDVGKRPQCMLLSRALHGEKPPARGLDDPLLHDFAESLSVGDIGEAASILATVIAAGLSPEWRGDAWIIVGLGWSQELLRLSSLLNETIPSWVFDMIYSYLADVASEDGAPISVKVEKASRVLGEIVELLDTMLGYGEPHAKAVRAYLEATGRPHTMKELVELLKEASMYPFSPENVLDIEVKPAEGGRVEICNNSRVPVNVMEILLAPGQCMRPILETPYKLPVEGPGSVIAVKRVERVRLELYESRAETISPSAATAEKLVGTPIDVRLTRSPIVRRFRIPVPFADMLLTGIINIGGLAATLLAVKDEKTVAVKMPKKALETLVAQEFFPWKTSLARALAREYKFLKSLSHPHVIRPIDYNIDRETGIPYLVLEYAEHGDLKGILSRHGPLPLREALKVGVQLADALELVHSRGIYHGDIKPENVVVDSHRIIKLTDFNVSRPLWASGTGETLAFTPGYSAPELYRWGHGRPGPWSDVYSLGILLYETITGKTPIRGVRIEDTPSPARWVIARMTHPDPRARPSAAEARDLLAGIYERL